MTPHKLSSAVGCSLDVANIWAPALDAACKRYGYDTPRRIACFVGQCAVESGGFKSFDESLTYKSAERILAVFPSKVKTLDQAKALVGNPKALANTVYAFKNGNGDVASGDGFRYHGRGPLQLTGRTNYAQYQAASGLPVLDNPDLLLQPINGADSAAWFCSRFMFKHCADDLNIDAITRQVNGPGMLGAGERRAFTLRLLSALGGV